MLVFLAKCLICITLIIVALQWRPPPAPTPTQNARGAMAPQPPRRPQLDEAARALVQSGVDALATSARDKCLASPRECAAALQHAQSWRER